MVFLSKKVGFILGAIITVSQAELVRYEFNVTSGVVNPDCFEYGVNVPHINGQFPGPIIYAQQGDEVEILVRNQISSDDLNTSLHYHGIRQIGSTGSDGVPGVSQHPIKPGESYLQKFKVTQQAGTYFYHAHVGLQDDSVQGSFIVYEDDAANPKKVIPNTLLKAGPYQYKKDLVLQLSEWWHEDLPSRQDYYTSDKFWFDHGADSILMNGRTVFDPAQKGLSQESCQGYTTFDVEPNTTYRLRIIGANSFRTLALAIKDHNMTMIEVDGELVHPYDTSFLEVTPGQRFSVLLKTGDYQPGTTFAIGTSYLWRQRGRGLTENGFGYIRYVKNQVSEENNTHLLKNFSKRAEWLGSKRTDDHEEDEDDEDDDDDDDDEEEENAGKCHAEKPKKRCKPKHHDSEEGEEEHGSERGGKHGENREQEDGEEKEGDWSNRAGNRHSGGRKGGRGSDSQAPEAGPSGGGRSGGDRGSGGSGGGWSGRTGGEEGSRPEGGRPSGGGGRSKKVEKIYVDMPTFPTMDEVDWLWHKITPLAPRDPIVDEMDVRTIKLHTSSKKLADNTTHYMVNQRMLPMRSTPLVNLVDGTTYTYSDDEQQYNDALGTYRINHNEIIDLVFQNTKNAVGGCLLHPWHTHGHSHYVIASGPGDYDHETDKDIRNFENPLFKDTTVAYPSLPTDDTDGCGWTKVRIVADNPGFWAVHCHITTHMIQGKMIVLEEAPELISTYNPYPQLN